MSATMTAADVLHALREARRLIQEKGWCQSEYALDATGKSVWPLSPDAVCYCADGALIVACANTAHDWTDIEEILGKSVGAFVPNWNDAEGQTVAGVLAGFDKAIAEQSP